MSTAYTITRDITPAEQPWMTPEETVKAGTTVYIYSGCTYGCIGDGIAVSLTLGKTPFFEVPRDAIKKVQQ